MPKVLFTSANAREMAAKGLKIRWSRPQLAVTPEKPIPLQSDGIADEYRDKLRSRTRKQLDAVADEIDRELAKRQLDHRRLKELTLTQSTLAEQQRKLAMWPDPGSFKPRPTRNTSPPPSLAPVTATPVAQPTPQPVVSCVSDDPSI